jgi:hypothetical protein
MNSISKLTNQFFAVVVISSLLASCGQNKKKQANREKFIADSVANAINVKTTLTDSLNKLVQLKSENEIALKKDEEDMNVANAKMQGIQEYTFLRTAAEKEDQIRTQTQEIQGVRESIDLHKNNIQILTTRIASLKDELSKF